MPLPRPRRESGMSSTAQDFERSNATTAAFLGGRQRTWMSSGNGASVAQAASSRNPQSRALELDHGYSNVVNGLRGASLQNTETIGDSAPNESRTVAVQGELGAPTPGSVLVSDRVGRSPTQGLEHQHLLGEVSLHSPSQIENRPPVRHDITSEDPASPLSQHDGATATRIEQLMANYGRVDEIEKHLRLAATSALPQLQPSPDHMFAARRDPSIQCVEPSQTGSPNPTSLLSHPSNGAATNSNAQQQIHQITEETREPVHTRPKPMPHHLSWPSLHTAFSTHQYGETSKFDSLMKACARVVTDRLKEVSKLGHRGPIEYARLDLLREACNRCDYAYVLLHQLYCRGDSNMNRKGIKELSRLHKQGLNALEQPLASNNRLPVDAISWFACFPGSLVAIQSLPWYDNALQTLAHLALHWNDLQMACSRRKYPPLVSEMLMLLQVQSVKLQEVVFRVILRDIMKEADQCFQKHEEIFLRNQQYCIDRSSRLQDFTCHDVLFVNEHQNVWASHLSHTPNGSWQSHPVSASVIPSTMGPPVSRPVDSVGHNASIGLREGTELSQLIRQGSYHSPIANPSYTRTASQSTPMSRHNSNQSSWQASNAPQSTSPDGQHRPYESGTEYRNATISSTTSWAPVDPTGAYPEQPHIPQYNSNGHAVATLNLPPRRDYDSGTITQGHRLRQSPTASIPARPTPPSPPTIHSLSGISALAHAQQHQLQISQHIQTNNVKNQQHSTPQMPIIDQFIRIPAARSQYALPEQPAPLTTALHHAGASSPIISTQGVEQCFRCIQHVFICPEAMSRTIRYQQHSVLLTPEAINALAKDSYDAMSAVRSRVMCPNSYTYRIRCVKSPLGRALPSTEEWVVSNHSWPSYIAILLNDQALDVRRQSHYGKDLPIDVTRIVKEGQNVLTMAIMDPSSVSNNNEQFFVGLEAIQTLSYPQTKFSIASLDLLTAQERILSRIRAATNDPDVVILQPEIVLDLTDPFTSSIFVVPVRGVNCTHTQCFDLDTFLSTRSGGASKDKSARPCSPDEFRCPICKGDVRPCSLVIDSFFQSIRDKLQAMGRLDVKAVEIGITGEWVIKEDEEERKGQAGDGDGKRARPQEEGTLGRGHSIEQSETKSDHTSFDRVSGVAAADRPEDSARTVITIDDDG